MKLKLTLESAGQHRRDLVATIDSATTIGELATYLTQADPERAPSPPSSRASRSSTAHPGGALDGEEGLEVDAASGYTLSLAEQPHLMVDPRLTILESGLRSGVAVAVTGRNDAVAEMGRPVAKAIIVAGPDCGAEFPLRPGTAYLGRERGVEIRLSDSSVSRRHARLVIAAACASAVVPLVEVVDLGSANGIWGGGAEVPRAILKDGDRVRLGDTEVEVRLSENAAGSAGAITAGSGSVGFFRSPRIAPLFEGSRFELPDLPERPRPSRMPWLAMMLPALMGMGIFALTQSPYALMFVLMSPMMMLGNYVEQRRGGRKDFEKAMRDFREDVEIVAGRIRESLGVEAEQRRAENPSSADCVQATRELSPLLWTRRGDMPGFLQLRLGLAALPSRSTMTMPAIGRSTAQAWAELSAALGSCPSSPGFPSSPT